MKKDIKVIVNTDGRKNTQFRINLPKEWCLKMGISKIEIDRMFVGEFDESKKTITLRMKELPLERDEYLFRKLISMRSYDEITSKEFMDLLDGFLDIYNGVRKSEFQKEKEFQKELEKNREHLDKTIEFIENFHSEILPELLLKKKKEFYEELRYKLATVLFYFQANFNFLHMEFFKGYCYGMIPYPNKLGLGLWKEFQVDLEDNKKESYFNPNVEKELIIGYYSDFLRWIFLYKTANFKLDEIEKFYEGKYSLDEGEHREQEWKSN